MNYHMHNYPASTVPHTAPVNMFDCHVVIGQHKIWETIVMIWKARKKKSSHSRPRAFLRETVCSEQGHVELHAKTIYSMLVCIDMYFYDKCREELRWTMKNTIEHWNCHQIDAK